MTIAPEELDLKELDWPTPEVAESEQPEPPPEPEEQLTPEQRRYRKFGWHPSVPDPDAPQPVDFEPVDYDIYAIAPSARVEEMQPMEYEHGGLIMGGGGGGGSVFDDYAEHYYADHYADYQGRRHYCYCSPMRGVLLEQAKYNARMAELTASPMAQRLPVIW